MAEIFVTSTADSGAGSLRQAIADAQDGDVILFDSDVFPVGQTTSILLSSYITINKSVSIYGGFNDGNGGYTSGATKRFYVYRDVDGIKTKVYIDDETPAQEGETILFENVCRVSLDAQNAGRCVRTGTIASASGLCVVSGLELKNGYTATSGGGALFAQNAMNLGLYDCAIVGANTDAGGGGIHVGSVATTNIFDACTFNTCAATQNGGAALLSSSSQNILSACLFDGCNSVNGGAIDTASTSQNTLNGCLFYGCTATTGGGAVHTTTTSINTLNACNFDAGTATSGGGLYAASTSQNTLNDCTISGCTATTDGGGVYSTSTSQNTLNDCTISGCTATQDAPNRNDVVIGSSEINNISASTIGFLFFGPTTKPAITNGITKANVLTCLTQSGNTATITIADGAALTLTESATIGAATFTSAGRGYLAVAAGIDTSAATLTNVVLCAYGADVSSFAEVDGVLEWIADDPSVSVLIEREDNDAWTTLTQTTGESLDYYLPPKVNLRLFDGERFLTTATPDSRTYFYIGGAEGSFDDAEDWSLTKDGTAIPQLPTITDCAFVIQGAEGDVAISKGSANVTGATIIPAGTNDIAVTVDEATVLAGTERFTGTLTTTGDVTINGDASQLAIVVDGTLEVAGSLKLATLTLTSGSSVVFASADDVLVVTGSATVNDATFSCEEPTAYFTAPVGTDLTQATFTNVYVATKGAEVVSVTGSRFGKNYSINIISEDNTLPVTVEYRLEGTTEWIVADPAFVGTTFQIRLDDDATFRVYNGEKFTEATMKVYGLYNEMAAIVEIGYLI